MKHLLILIGRNVASSGKGICGSVVDGVPANNGDLPAMTPPSKKTLREIENARRRGY